MKIGYFTAGFPYKNPLTGESTGPYVGGGVENVTYNLAIQMARRGHDVYIFTSSINSIGNIEDYTNIKIYRYKTNFNIGQAPISLDLIYKPLFCDIDLDIIHSHIGNLPAPFTAYLYAKKKKKPLITTYHEDWVKGFGSMFRKAGVFIFDSFIADLLLNASDIILTPSEYYIDESKHLCNYKSKVYAIPNGINIEDFKVNLDKKECREQLNLPLEKKIILFVGSLTPRKAPDVLIKSMFHVIDKIPDSHLVFVGDGNYVLELKSMVKEMKLEGNITFSGFVDDNIKNLYYYSSDIFVLPSISEGFGIVLLEASACGLPLVVSKLEVFNSVVTENYNGLFTITKSDSDLANKLILLLENDDLRKSMSFNAKQNVEIFSWDKIAEKTEKIYLDLVESYKNE